MTIDATIAVVEARPLGANDLERVIAIDQALSGRSRRRFFEKRCTHCFPFNRTSRLLAKRQMEKKRSGWLLSLNRILF